MTHVVHTSEDGPHDFERELALVEKLKLKDPEAWKYFIISYRVRLHTAIRRSLAKYHLPADRRDDVEQKTWFTAFQKIEQFQPQHRNSLHYWLVTIQRNHVRNFSREPAPVELEEHLTEAEGELPTYFQPAYTGSPENEFIKAENHREIWLALEMALQTLSPREREIMLRRFVRKEDVETLAAVYNVKVQTIYQITANTKRKIGNYLMASDLFLRVHSDRTGKESHTWKK